MLLALAAVVATLLVVAAPAPASGQPGPGGVVGGAMSCTASLVTSFTPCLNFITNGSASPTDDCCRSLGALMRASTGCACLILTGSVSVGVPVNRTLAVRLPRACNSTSLQLQCRDASSAQSPAPGPVADAPAPSLSTAPLPPPATAAAAPEPDEAPAPATPTAAPPVSQGQTRPTVVPGASSSSSSTASSDAPATAGFVLLLAIGAALMT